MVTVIILIMLGVLTQVVVLATNRSDLPRFSKACPTCGNRLPPMEYPPAMADCLECERLIALGVDLSDPLPRP
jgi:hypothetical protein